MCRGAEFKVSSLLCCFSSAPGEDDHVVDEDGDFDASVSDLSRESAASALTDLAMGGVDGRKSSGHAQSRGW